MVVLIITTYYGWLKRLPIGKEEPPNRKRVKEQSVSIQSNDPTIKQLVRYQSEHITKTVKPIEKEKPTPSVAIQPYDTALKHLVRFQSEQRTKTVKEYSKKAMPKNYYLRLANTEYTVTWKENQMYFDFKYKFLYCPTPKVTNYFDAKYISFNLLKYNTFLCQHFSFIETIFLFVWL